MKKIYKIILILTISFASFVFIHEENLIENTNLTSGLPNVKTVSLNYNYRILTGENLIKVQNEENSYKAEIYNNDNIVNINIISNSKVYTDDYIVLRDDNSVAGEIINEVSPVIRANLKEGINTIKLIKRSDNLEICRFYINYNPVKVYGLTDNINTGDNFNLTVKINNIICKNVKWTSVGINHAMISDNGNVTAFKSGLATVLATIYDDKNENIIGSLNLQFNISGTSKLGWIKNNNKWYYIDKVTNTFRTGWLLDNNKWYFLNQNGVMETGNIKINGTNYFFQDNGELLIK